MTTRTKIILALAAVFVGMLAIYYGVIYPSGSDVPDPLASSDPLAADDAKTSGPSASADLAALGRPAPDVSSDGADRPGGPWTASKPLGIDLEPLDSLDSTTPPLTGTLGAALPGVSGPSRPGTTLAGGAPAGSDWPRSTVPSADPEAIDSAAGVSPIRKTGPRLTKYTVKRRDTMSSIAQEWLGNPDLWPLVAQANPRVDPLRLQIGQTIQLPPRGAASAPQASAPKAGRPADTSERIHVVRSGENLSRVALNYYGDDRKWRAIYTANRGKIGSDPDQLEVGMQLVIPDA